MGKVGLLFEVAGLLAGFVAIAFYAISINKDSKSNAKTADFLLVAQAFFVTISTAVLIYALATGYFKMEYVAQYTDSALPMIYKLSAWWAGQAGSLYFWGWLVSVFALIELYRLRNYSVKYKSSVLLTMAITATFFYILTTFVAKPFKELNFFPADGMGMNPLLQNPGMLYHPPTLYVGFAGFTVALGHAVAAFFTKDKTDFWLKDTRKWSIITWIFLTVGIVLGGQWAYVELGWGGYWAWDPVENASLLPWFTGTAFLHSAVMFEKRRKLKIWTYILILITFELCIFATFLTRSGIIDSVHSFGKSSLGAFFLWFIILTSAVFLYLLFKNKNNLKDEGEFSISSKEGLFYVTNWLFVGIMAVVLFGTTLPIFSQLFMGSKLSVGIPYYNKVSTPFFMAILILSGICPLVPYTKTKKIFNIKNVWLSIPPTVIFGVLVFLKNLRSIIPNIGLILAIFALIYLILLFRKELWLSFIFMVIATVGIYAYGYTKIIPLILFAFTSFSLFTIVLQFYRGIRQSGIKIIGKNRRLYGGLVIHLGVMIMAYGVIASSFYNVKFGQVVSPGDTISFSDYNLKVGNLEVRERENYVSVYAPVDVHKDGKYLVTMTPERRFYRNHEEAFAEVAIYTKPYGDLYLILASYSKPDNVIGIQAIFEPFIVWIWVGCGLMVIGGLYAISYRRIPE